MSIFGPPGPPFWGPGARFSGTFFSVYFAPDFGGFRVPRRGPNLTSGLGGRGVPRLVFLDISPRIGVFTVCLLQFRLLGFPVPLRERLPVGNLPLSEVLRQNNLTE